MNEPKRMLSAQSIKILEKIAAGCTYEQILATYPDLTYLDIFRAAEESLKNAVGQPEPHRPAYTVAEKRERYPRAYEPWSEAEEAQLLDFIRAGETIAQIATHLKRNRGAIRSRINQLDLVTALSAEEQSRFRSIVARDEQS